MSALDIREKNSVLIVDNEVDEVKLLANILQPDYTVFKSEDHTAALKMAEANRPDLILLDMSSKEIITTLAGNPDTREIPIIILLDTETIEENDEDFLVGAVDYIQKPLPPVVVKSRVRNHMRMLNQKRILDRLDDVDRMTEVYSAKFFLTRLDQEWRRAMRDGTELSVIVVALDDLGKLTKNQRERAIKGGANIIRSNIKRSMDITARWEEEVFVLLLPNTPRQGATMVAEIVRKNVEATPVPKGEEGPTSITATLGVSSAAPGMNTTSEDFFRSAMDAFSKIKAQEKNIVHGLMEN